MEFIMLYIVKSAFFLSVFYIIYWLFFRNDTYFTVNRFYLIGVIILSFIIPLINISINSAAESGVYSKLLDTITVSTDSLRQTFTQEIGYIQAILLIYGTGVLLFFLRFSFQFYQLYRLIKRYGITNKEGLNIVFTDSNYAPFSFFNVMFLNKNIDENDSNKIIAHEKVHMQQRHSFDIIILELVTIFQWFNPFIWMYRISLKEVHEYLADEGVLLKGIEKGIYQQLLLSLTLGVQINEITNNFNKSLIKRRFIMMTKMKSSIPAKFKILLIIPFLVLFISVFACSNKDILAMLPTSDVLNTNEIPPPPPPPPPPAPPTPGSEEEIQASNSTTNSDEKVFKIVEVMPEFKGGHQALIDFMVKNVKYPENAKNKNIQGKVFVSFVITSTGKVSNAKVVQSVDKELDAEALRCIAVMPDWIPGKDKGQPVDVELTLPVQFKLH